MPEPIIEPETIMVASKRPSPLTGSDFSVAIPLTAPIDCAFSAIVFKTLRHSCLAALVAFC